MRIFFTTLILTLVYNTAYPQINTEDLILTKEQNKEWINQLREKELDQQLFQIKNRILADSNVYLLPSPNPHGQTKLNKADSLKIKGVCKPLYLVFYSAKPKEPIIVHPNNYDVLKLNDLITYQTINRIYVMDAKASVIYGSSANCGVIYLYTSKNKYYKEFQKLTGSK